MNTTGMVMTVTDELLAELEDLASAATPGPWKAVDYGSYDGKMQQFYVDTSFKRADIFESGGDIEPNNNDLDRGAADMQFVACANPATIAALTAELRRLRAENAGLAKSLAESRANDQAAMGWLTSLRWASGDRGERMLPELVEHIERLVKDAGRLDLLDSLCESYGFQDVHEGNRWVVDGPFRDIRTAADSLEAR